MQFGVNFIQKFATGKKKQASDSRSEDSDPEFVRKECLCVYKYFSYEKGCFLRTIFSQAIFFLLFLFRILFCAQTDYWIKMKSLIITNQKMRVFQQSRCYALSDLVFVVAKFQSQQNTIQNKRHDAITFSVVLKEILQHFLWQKYCLQSVQLEKIHIFSMTSILYKIRH